MRFSLPGSPAEQISTLVNVAGITIKSYWPSLFAKLAVNRNINDLILDLGCAAAAAHPLSIASFVGNVAVAAPVKKKVYTVIYI
ncbi:hypothetical protein Csa_000270 [Cucumis sativus]|uniref:Uncharacterized protein n=1 Tax=Cucumis sativus TaxID=3659 RepID=A0A0A0KJB7_CUCSA|nr:hypothetical protein Csa_000270 [Cucumis sativus]